MTEHLLDGLALHFGRLEQRPPFCTYAVNTAVFVIAVRVTDVVLHVADQRVVPIGDVQGAVSADLDIRRTEVGISRNDDRLDLDGGNVGAVILYLVLQDALEADDIANQEVAVIAFGKVAAG